MSSKDNCRRRLDVRASPWDLRSFNGRWHYYAWITDPRLALIGSWTIDDAKKLLELYEGEKEPPGTTPELIGYAKRLHEGCVHPETGCRIPRLARFSSVPIVQTALTAAMVTFCRSIPQVWFWQLVHNSYHAYINQANGNGTAPRTPVGQAVALGSATVVASVVAVPFKATLSRALCHSRFRTLIPLTVVMLSQAVSVPLSRQYELRHGVEVRNEEGETFGASKAAAALGISQTAVSRMILFAPSMLLVPLMTMTLQRQPFLRRSKFIIPAIQVVVSSALFTLMVPMSLALFSPTASLDLETLRKFDPEIYESVMRLTQRNSFLSKPIPCTHVYFSKGL
nr:PREDICTED: sideroflexin-2-like [Bemisia tabaci]